MSSVFGRDDVKTPIMRLPNLPVDSAPVRELVSSDGDICVVYPIYELGCGMDSVTARRTVLPALWSRRSLLMNTDCMDQPVDVKFAVEEKVLDVVLPIFEENGVNSDEYVLFDGRKYEVDPFYWMGKQTGWMECPEIRDYEWVVHMDGDVFFCRPPGVSEKMPFFEKLRDCPQEFGVILKWELDSPSIYNEHGGVGWARWVVKDYSPEIHKESTELWLKRVEDVTDEDVASKFRDGHLFDRGLMFICFYPLRKYRREAPGLLDWFVRASRAMQECHSMYCLFELYWGRMHPTWDFSELTGFDFFCSDSAFYNSDEVKKMPYNDLVARFKRKIECLNGLSKPYIFHASHAGHFGHQVHVVMRDMGLWSS